MHAFKTFNVLVHGLTACALWGCHYQFLTLILILDWKIWNSYFTSFEVLLLIVSNNYVYDVQIRCLQGTGSRSCLAQAAWHSPQIKAHYTLIFHQTWYVPFLYLLK